MPISMNSSISNPAGNEVYLSANGTSLVDGDGNVVRTGLPIIVDPRDWNGFDVTGNNDNSTILQAAIAASAYQTRDGYTGGTSYRLLLPPGKIAFSSQLTIGQNCWMEGSFGADGGSELWWSGADGVDAIVNTATSSFCYLSNFRLEDKRVGQTSGRGITLKRAYNGTSLHRLMVMHFPLEQIYIGADSGTSSECIALDDIWVSSNKATSKGILLERLDNSIIINNIKSDIATTPANDGYVIRCEIMAFDSAAIEISNVKHESNNRCPTISLPATSYGNLSIRNVIQRNPSGGAAGAGDVIQLGAAASASAYWFDNTGSGRTTGASSENGVRLLLQNIAGANHSDWTGASGAATVRGLGTGQAVYQAVRYIVSGANGRFARHIAGNNIPNGSVYGNAGDRYTRLDATSGTCAEWVKQTGSATNISWIPLIPETQSPAFSASFACNLQSGNRVSIAAMTASMTHQSPTNIPPQGVVIEYNFLQNGTGGYGITWSALHKGSWPTASGTANQKKTVRGVSDGTNILFQGDSGWY